MVKTQTATSIPWVCSACIRAHTRRRAFAAYQARERAFSVTAQAHDQPARHHEPGESRKSSDENVGQGAMSRRLADMAEETMDSGSASDRKIMADAGFSDELRKQLEDRIAQTSFAAENQQALSQASMPSSAGKGTRDQAAAKAWTGSESLHDAALRMLDDSHKRIRMPSRKPSLSPLPLKPRPKQKISTADRLANARDRTSIYTLQQESMSEKEKEQYRKELKERFTPGARPMPTTLQGLTSLANERIEDAIARGQFKSIERGKGVNIARDYTANSPFIDTTEYFMNKIIQKQEIVPPWIEKQQELMKLINSFRQRLRNDWRRHAARTISGKGGSIEEQVRRAKAFALAEEIHNPRPAAKSETMSGIDSSGTLTTITIEERIAAGVTPDPVPDVTEIKVTQTTPAQDSQGEPTPGPAEILSQDSVVLAQDTTILESGTPAENGTESSTSPAPVIPERVLPMAYPFRDEAWEKAEHSYQSLAINEINALARSYNLMAPKIAQKPYYSLPRELKRCYAEVAATLPDEILNRSIKGPVRVQVAMHKEGSLMQKFQGTGHVAKVRDEPETRGYGFKEFWKDLFSKDEGKKREIV